MDNIYQSIEILSKEKGIDPQIVLDAVKDAMMIAARKHFRTVENYEADFSDKNGGIRLFAVKTVAERSTIVPTPSATHIATTAFPAACPATEARAVPRP